MKEIDQRKAFLSPECRKEIQAIIDKQNQEGDNNGIGLFGAIQDEIIIPIAKHVRELVPQS